ncbi:MAG: hypothetical protein RL021_1418 [Bacteroidota bacterium]
MRICSTQNDEIWVQMELKNRINILKSLGIRLEEVCRQIDPANDNISSDWSSWLGAVQTRNPWFTRASVHLALTAWTEALRPEKVEQWAGAYELPHLPSRLKLVGVINAGNIPFVGMHDLLSVFLSGHRYVGKNASDDPYLLPWVLDLMKSIDPQVAESVSFTEKLVGTDAVIATGSDNSARYFEYYFGKNPHIIRKNRNGIAVLTGEETTGELTSLGADIFSYFGLGCRNISKLFVPHGYDFSPFFEAIYPWHVVMGHHKYMNNFDYHHAVFLLKQLPFLQNNFLMIREDERIASPLAVVHYEFYDDLKKLTNTLVEKSDLIQCVAVSERTKRKSEPAESDPPFVDFGKTQFPSLQDYADGVDTVKFLAGL